MKTLLKCPDCSHAYFEGEGCRGCLPKIFDNKCKSDGYESFKEKRCDFCAMPIPKECRLFNYCSLDCKMELLYQRRLRDCQWCGDKISNSNPFRRMYCSKQCSADAFKARAYIKYQSKSNPVE